MLLLQGLKVASVHGVVEERGSSHTIGEEEH
jgi:hypothetical protein